MNRFRTMVSTLLVLSLAVNGWFGIKLYQNSRILQMQSDSYNSFKLLLSNALTETDKAVHDVPGSNTQAKDIEHANMALERAMGTIMGLRTDFAKKEMDIFPIYLALAQAESPDIKDLAFANGKAQSIIEHNSRTLHDLYSELTRTSFSDTGLHQLKDTILAIDKLYDGYPSYSSLR